MSATRNDKTNGSKRDLQMAVANPTALNEQIISLKTEWQGASKQKLENFWPKKMELNPS